MTRALRSMSPGRAVLGKLCAAGAVLFAAAPLVLMAACSASTTKKANSSADQAFAGCKAVERTETENECWQRFLEQYATSGSLEQWSYARLRMRSLARGGASGAWAPASSAEPSSAPASACTSVKKTVFINANGGWQPTGISVPRLAALDISAKGEVHTCAQGGCGDKCYAKWVGPEGVVGCPTQSNNPVPRGPSMALIAKLGGPAQLVGKSKLLASTRSAELELAVNDTIFDDNAGSFQVDIKVTCPSPLPITNAT